MLKSNWLILPRVYRDVYPPHVTDRYMKLSADFPKLRMSDIAAEEGIEPMGRIHLEARSIEAISTIEKMEEFDENLNHSLIWFDDEAAIIGLKLKKLIQKYDEFVGLRDTDNEVPDEAQMVFVPVFPAEDDE